MDPALFLDRDGVIMENRASYVRNWGDVEFYPQALEALYNVRSSPYKVFLITNQSAVGRGIITLEKARSINQMVVNYIEQAGGRIDDVFMCPHAPDENCNCRKPRPGLILQAVEKYPIDLNRSIMVGDAISDMVAGQSAGIPFTMMVRTGRGNSQIADATVEQISFIEVYDNLLEIFTQLFSQNPWWGT
jgi:histidinol-phosphate phosphatase family protein